MNKKSHDGKCPLCGGGKQLGTTTYTVDTGTGLIVVRNVKAEICTQCGEEWIDNATARELEKIVDEAREKRHQVEVVAM
ncbi:MAG: type II toxin-antitoxin system MqsA family antitoxin [Bacteroidetes bacterium]|nr:type II toxin-antitoxin system MqsA family antitoxin [Bacteroidota bacterium]